VFDFPQTLGKLGEEARQIVTQWIDDGGYDRPELWLSDGWDERSRADWQAPLYWQRTDGRWQLFTLHGLRDVDGIARVRGPPLDLLELLSWAHRAGGPGAGRVAGLERRGHQEAADPDAGRDHPAEPALDRGHRAGVGAESDPDREIDEAEHQ
jgi:hypothetical protein